MRPSLVVFMTLNLCFIVEAHICWASDISSLSVKFPKLDVQKNERVVALEMHVSSGMVDLISNIPIGWYVSLDNDAGWNATIKANIIVGAAALSADQLRNIVLNIKKNEFSGLKFAVSADVSVSKNFIDVRHILFGQDQLVEQGNEQAQ